MAMIAALVSGVLLGLTAGLSPGPMLALVLSQSFRHGAREGCKVALTPLVTDPPIILVTLVLASKLARQDLLLGLMSITGAIFVVYLVWESFNPGHPGAAAQGERPASFFKGIVINLLNPHPWIFWLTVGAAILAQALARSWLVVAAFLGGFYALLVGSKIGVALIAGRSRDLLAGRTYLLTMRVLAGLLALFALLLFREGLKHLKMI